MASEYQSNYAITTVTEATETITPEAHAGHFIVVNRAAGCTLTLPLATGSGNHYRIIAGVDMTGDLIVEASGSDIMQGSAILGNDSAGASCFYTAGNTAVTTFDGSTTGGYRGGEITLVDMDDAVWLVRVISEASGTEATPFSAS